MRSKVFWRTTEALIGRITIIADGTETAASYLQFPCTPDLKIVSGD